MSFATASHAPNFSSQAEQPQSLHLPADYSWSVHLPIVALAITLQLVSALANRCTCHHITAGQCTCQSLHLPADYSWSVHLPANHGNRLPQAPSDTHTHTHIHTLTYTYTHTRTHIHPIVRTCKHSCTHKHISVSCKSSRHLD